MWYMVQNLRCTFTIDSVLAYSKTQNAFLFPVHAMFSHDCPLVVKPSSTPRHLVHKKTWRDSLPIDMLLTAVSVLVVARLSSEVPEGLMNYPVCVYMYIYIYIYKINMPLCNTYTSFRCNKPKHFETFLLAYLWVTRHDYKGHM